MVRVEFTGEIYPNLPGELPANFYADTFCLTLNYSSKRHGVSHQAIYLYPLAKVNYIAAAAIFSFTNSSMIWTGLLLVAFALVNRY